MWSNKVFLVKENVQIFDQHLGAWGCCFVKTWTFSGHRPTQYMCVCVYICFFKLTLLFSRPSMRKGLVQVGAVSYYCYFFYLLLWVHKCSEQVINLRISSAAVISFRFSCHVVLYSTLGRLGRRPNKHNHRVCDNGLTVRPLNMDYWPELLITRTQTHLCGESPM